VHTCSFSLENHAYNVWLIHPVHIHTCIHTGVCICIHIHTCMHARMQFQYREQCIQWMVEWEFHPDGKALRVDQRLHENTKISEVSSPILSLSTSKLLYNLLASLSLCFPGIPVKAWPFRRTHVHLTRLLLCYQPFQLFNTLLASSIVFSWDLSQEEEDKTWSSYRPRPVSYAPNKYVIRRHLIGISTRILAPPMQLTGSS
jgi:hypothetical protein